MATRRAQAMVELALGMFALALVVSALSAFAVAMARSLRAQNTARTNAQEAAEPVEVGEFAAKYIFGSDTITIRESAVMPPAAILR